MAAVGESEPLEWIYLDEQRTHEVHARVEPLGNGNAFTVIELPFGVRDARDAVERVEPIGEAWEAKLAFRELEARLTASGLRYFRFQPMTRKMEPLPFRTPLVDLRAQEVPIPDAPAGSVMRFFHFHGNDRSRLLVTVPRLDLDAGAQRFALAELSFRFPRADTGDARLLHARLAPGMLRSQWVNVHLDLPREGFKKLATPLDYLAAFGPDWQDNARTSFKLAMRRVLDGAWGAEAPPPEREPPAPEFQEEALLRAVLAGALVRRLKQKFLRPGEDDELLAGGELAIRRAIATKRRVASQGDQHDLSLIEAALLCDYALGHARKDLLHEDGRRLLRQVGEHVHEGATSRVS